MPPRALTCALDAPTSDRPTVVLEARQPSPKKSWETVQIRGFNPQDQQDFSIQRSGLHKEAGTWDGLKGGQCRESDHWFVLHGSSQEQLGHLSRAAGCWDQISEQGGQTRKSREVFSGRASKDRTRFSLPMPTLMMPDGWVFHTDKFFTSQETPAWGPTIHLPSGTNHLALAQTRAQSHGPGHHL